MQITPLFTLIGLATAAVINPAHNGTAPTASTYENVDISGLSVRETFAGAIQSASMKLNSNITCSADITDLTSGAFVCSDAAYKFAVVKGTTSDYALRIYKQTSTYAGLSGLGDVSTYCHSGGGDVMICAQVSATTIVISA